MRSGGNPPECPVRWEGEWHTTVHAPAIRLDNTALNTLESVCGVQVAADGLACCASAHLDDLERQLAEVAPMMSICPACWNNYREALCTLKCSPNQYKFMNVTEEYRSIDDDDPDWDGDPVDCDDTQCKMRKMFMHVSDEWKQGIFDSCKDVKYGKEAVPLLNLVGSGSGSGSERDVPSFMDALTFEWVDGMSLSLVSPNATGDLIPKNITPYDPLARNCADLDSDSRCGCTNCRESCPTIDPPPMHASCAIGNWPCIDVSLIVFYASVTLILVTRYFVQRRKARSRRLVEYADDPDQSGSGYVAISNRDLDERPPISLSSASPLHGRSRGDIDSESSSDEGPRRVYRSWAGVKPTNSSSTLWHWLLAEDSVILTFFIIWGAFCARNAKRVLFVGFIFIVSSFWMYTNRDYEFGLYRLLDKHSSRYSWIQEHELVDQMFWGEAYLIDASTRPLVSSRAVPVSDVALQHAKQALTYDRLRWWSQVEKEMGEVRRDPNGPTWKDFCKDQPDPRSCRPTSVRHMLFDLEYPEMEFEWDFDLDHCVASSMCFSETPGEIVFGPAKEVINVIDPKRVLSGVPNGKGASKARASMATWDVRHPNSSANARTWAKALDAFLSQVAGRELATIQDEGGTKLVEHPLSLRRRELDVDLSFITNASWDKEFLHGARPGLAVLAIPYALAFLFLALGLRRTHVDVSPVPATSVHWYKRLRTMLINFFWMYHQSAKLGLALLYVLCAHGALAFTQGFLNLFDMQGNWASTALTPVIVLGVMVDSALVFNTEMERQLVTSQSAGAQTQMQAPESDSDTEPDESTTMLRTSSSGDMSVASEMPAHLELHHGDGPAFSTTSVPHLVGKALGGVGPTLLLRTVLMIVALLFCVILPVRLSESVALHAAISLIVVGIAQFTVFPAAFSIDSGIALRAQNTKPIEENWNVKTTRLQSALSPWLTREMGQLFVLVCAFGTLAFGIAGASRLTIGMENQSMVRATSLLRAYFDTSDMFANFGPQTWWNDNVIEELDDADILRRMCSSIPGCGKKSEESLAESARYWSSPLFAQTSEMWINDYLAWLHPVNEFCCRVRLDNSTQLCSEDDLPYECRPCMQDHEPPYTWDLKGLPKGEEAGRYLEAFRRFIPTYECPYGLSGLGLKRYLDPFSAHNSFTTTMVPLRTHNDRQHALYALNYLKQVMAKQQSIHNSRFLPSTNTLPLMPLAQEEHIRAWLTFILCITAITMALILGIVLGSIRLAALVFATTACTSITLVGAMGWVGIPLNVITLVCLGVCTATAAGAATQVVRAYIYAPPEYVSHLSPPRKERAARVAYALGHGGPVVMHGPLVTCVYVALALGIAPVAVACRIAGSLWLLLGVICAFYTLLVLPVLLSMYGGYGYDRTSDKQHLVARVREQQPDLVPEM